MHTQQKLKDDKDFAIARNEAGRVFRSRLEMILPLAHYNELDPLDIEVSFINGADWAREYYAKEVDEIKDALLRADSILYGERTKNAQLKALQKDHEDDWRRIQNAERKIDKLQEQILASAEEFIKTVNENAELRTAILDMAGPLEEISDRYKRNEYGHAFVAAHE